MNRITVDHTMNRTNLDHHHPNCTSRNRIPANPISGTRQTRARRTLAAAAALPLLVGALAGCGGDDESSAEPEALTIEMADFHYGTLPSEVAAGTRVEVVNLAPTELHEVVAFRLPDDETRGIDEIVGPDLGLVLEGLAPTMVVLAAPGGEAIVPVGEPVFAEPGRYVLLCFIPTGADPAEYLQAAATSEGPPQVDGGPPHFVHGMYAELTVTS